MGGMTETTSFDVYDRNCPGRAVMEHIASRWGVLVLAVLLDGTLRFSELRRAVGGVSEKMLAQTLQALERDGLVHREVRPVIPPHVDYSLTAVGVPIAEQVRGLYRLIEGSTAKILRAQADYDERRAATR
ncbi:helix-turn-helix domain-containing protein [Actinokineospora auranticolor]|uniref:DNA-binding HxlR family transcriptional regulator n=1 Tax=Actinokineospora auranticolor TaxID=155976 RepID=A0A2S6GZ63_9PSEU|nr:helix-turn-helix domain-containing protein [Actinokineospora auranticolor]PPK70450.1 DNA-binding HxlR family transcriptional regulator [Actinokineospora auranticolor]